MVELRPFCDSLKSKESSEAKSIKPFLLDDQDWSLVNELLNVLKPFNHYSTSVQRNSCTMSDLFFFWTSLEIKMKSSTSVLANYLLSEMETRKQVLFNNPIAIASIYLDPRYQRGLSVGQKNTAVIFLTSLYKKIVEVESQATSPESADSTENAEKDPKSTSAEDVAALLDLISSENESDASPIIDNDIKQKIEGFSGVKACPKTNLFEFWQNNQRTMPELYKLASLIFSISPTQTSVERAFSALAIVLTSRRTRLNNNTLESILLIRLNFDLYNGILQNPIGTI